ncbi:MAG: MBL fold metallo-hydrolase [Acidobacteria bacterium]|nr:MBL fold metallo-hydrolase [Acidobacteriota bacterium]MBV9145998.1 MBL fold metallo-hydrolase [Acidobacteriota bacterium]MBV9435043.1 MBL fold metallo-hydrolase [Acidobacteriota bacterium]
MKTALDRPARKLGDFELTILSDGLYYADGGAMFGVVPKPLWEKKIQADERNRIPCGTNAVLVRAFGRIVLIETGIGNKLPEKLAEIYSFRPQLLQQLEAAGVRRQEVEVVINSHLHFDHCGWNTFLNERGVVEPTFPNATYYVQRAEWEHGCRQLERDRVSYISDNYDPLLRNGQMRLLDGEGDIMPGISAVIYPGHTRNMQAIMLESEGETACYISDLLPTSWHLDLSWVMAYDLFPLETIDSRKRFFQQAIPGKWLTIFTHDHFMPWAFLEWDERGKVLAKRPQVDL